MEGYQFSAGRFMACYLWLTVAIVTVIAVGFVVEPCICEGDSAKDKEAEEEEDGEDERQLLEQQLYHGENQTSELV